MLQLNETMLKLMYQYLNRYILQKENRIIVMQWQLLPSILSFLVKHPIPTRDSI